MNVEMRKTGKDLQVLITSSDFAGDTVPGDVGGGEYERIPQGASSHNRTGAKHSRFRVSFLEIGEECCPGTGRL